MAKAAPTPEKKDTTYGDLITQKRTYEELELSQLNITTGSLMFDIFTGGGYSPGIARFMAPPEHGKTLQALTWAKNWLNHWGDKGEVVYFDCEGRLTPKKINLSGINKIPDFKKRFTVYRYNIYNDIAKFLFDITMNNPEGKHYFIVFDSLDMLITKEDTAKDFGDAAKVGAAQVMTTLLMKKVGPYMADKQHHLHILSQIRANINVSNPNSPKTKISGGNAALHAADIMGEVQKNFGGNEGMFIFENPQGKTVKEKGNIVGHYHTIRFTKTMNEKTGQTLRIPIKRGAGIWREREITDLALAFGQITKKGAWYDFTNAEWIKRINEDLTIVKQNQYVEQALAKAQKEADVKGETLNKAKIKELNEIFQKEAKNQKFEVEVKWQGYENLFNYIENNPELVEWMDKEFRATLVSDSVAIDVGEADSTFE